MNNEKKLIYEVNKYYSKPTDFEVCNGNKIFELSIECLIIS